MGSYPELNINLSSELTLSASSPKGNIGMAVVINAPRGRTNPVFFSSHLELVKEYGIPDLAYGKSLLYADTLLRDCTDNLLVTRAVSEDSKFGGSLVRGLLGEENLTDLAEEIVVDLGIKPITGLTKAELDAYIFPLYPRTRVYELADMSFAPYYEDNTESIFVTSLDGYEVGGMYSLSDTTDDPEATAEIFRIKLIDTTVQSILLDKVKAQTADTVPVDSVGALYIIDDNLIKQPIMNIHSSTEIAQNTLQEFIIEDSDNLTNGSDYNIVDSADTVIISVNVSTKESYTQEMYEVEFESRPTSDYFNQYFFEIIAGDFEYRDSGLVTSKGQGLDNKHISVGIEPDKATEDSFKFVVYYKGIQVETHKCSMLHELDGDGIQLEVETVVNNNSRYVNWLTNQSMLDEDDVLKRPLDTIRTKWQRLKEIYYVDSGYVTVEDFLPEDQDLKVDDVASFSVDDRIQLRVEGLYESLEYKVQSINAVDKILTLDRPFESTEDDMPVGTSVYVFDDAINIPEENIYGGYTLFVVSELDYVQPTALGTNIKVGDYQGYVYDGGANPSGGGTDGSPCTIANLTNALDLTLDIDMYPHFFQADGGFTDDEYIRDLIDYAQKREVTHSFTSCKLASEYNTDPAGAILDDRDAVMYSSSYFSFTSDWFYMTNPYTGQKNIPMPPSLSDLLAEAGAINSDGIWTASAGWRKGKYFTSGLVRPKDLGERKRLYEGGVNTSKYKRGKGVAKWSDLTGLNSERPLQYRSTAKLAIYLIYNLSVYLEDKHFEDYSDSEIADTEEDINAFLGTVLNAGGIYDFSVIITDLVTDATIASRVLPIYVAVNGMSFIQGVNLAVDMQSGKVTSTDLADAKKLTA